MAVHGLAGRQTLEHSVIAVYIKEAGVVMIIAGVTIFFSFMLVKAIRELVAIAKRGEWGEIIFWTVITLVFVGATLVWAASSI